MDKDQVSNEVAWIDELHACSDEDGGIVEVLWPLSLLVVILALLADNLDGSECLDPPSVLLPGLEESCYS